MYQFNALSIDYEFTIKEKEGFDDQNQTIGVCGDLTFDPFFSEEEVTYFLFYFIFVVLRTNSHGILVYWCML